tara:strand:- start:12613 stop:13506 length:894 start_codon:yes stop_codon:yes gene_type:complete
MENQIRGHGSLYKSYQERHRQGRENRALEVLRETGYFDRQGNNDSSIVDVEGAKQNIEGTSSGESDNSPEVLPTYNAGAQTERNRQSQMNQMLQQHGKVLLDPAGGAVMGAGLGLALGDGKLQNALIGGGLGYLLARSNTINLPRGNKSFDESQAVEGTKPIGSEEIQPAPELQRDEVTSQSEAVYEKKADISGIDPEAGDLAFAPSLTDADTNRSNAFADPVTLLAQSVKTTTEDDFNPAFNSNMQPQVGGESGLELPAPGGQPGNVPNPADELVTSFAKGRVPNYVFKTLGGSVA